MNGPANYMVRVADQYGVVIETRGWDWETTLMVARLLAQAYPCAAVDGFNEDQMDGAPDAKRKNGLTDEEQDAFDEAVRASRKGDRNAT